MRYLKQRMAYDWPIMELPCILEAAHADTGLERARDLLIALAPPIDSKVPHCGLEMMTHHFGKLRLTLRRISLYRCW
jgi:hypothetical protein